MSMHQILFQIRVMVACNAFVLPMGHVTSHLILIHAIHISHQTSTLTGPGGDHRISARPSTVHWELYPSTLKAANFVCILL